MELRGGRGLTLSGIRPVRESSQWLGRNRRRKTTCGMLAAHAPPRLGQKPWPRVQTTAVAPLAETVSTFPPGRATGYEDRHHRAAGPFELGRSVPFTNGRQAAQAALQHH